MTEHELGAYLRTRGISISEFARQIGVANPKVVYRYLNRERVPAPHVVERIYVETGGAVPPSTFYRLPALGGDRSEQGPSEPAGASGIADGGGTKPIEHGRRRRPRHEAVELELLRMYVRHLAILLDAHGIELPPAPTIGGRPVVAPLPADEE